MVDITKTNKRNIPTPQGVASAVPILSGVITLLLLIPVHLNIRPPMLLLERFFPGSGWLEIALLTVYAGMLTRIMLKASDSGKWRSRYWRLFSLVFFTQLILGVTVSSKFLMTGELHLPIPAMILAGPIFRGRLSYMVFILAGTILLAGPGWCGHLCYIGAFDDFLSKRRKTPESYEPILPYLRYVIILATIGAALLFRFVLTGGSLGLFTALAFGIGGLFVSIVLSRKRGQMVHCTAYCPIGGIVVFLGKISPFRITIDRASCNNCGLCSSACRYGALAEHHISTGVVGWNCSFCGDCLSRCSKGSLKMTFFQGKRDAWPYYVAVVVGLHASFLGLARI